MPSLLALWNGQSPLLQSVLALLIVMIVYVSFRGLVLGRLERLAVRTDNDLDDRLIHFLKQFLWMLAAFVAFIWVLRINSIEVTPLLAGAGIAGVAMGFAARETLADILSGVFLIADRPVKVGDRVRIEAIGRHWGAWGDVVDIGLRRTQVRNTDGVVVNYPNSLLSNSIITNFSAEEQPVRVRIRFQVAYDADIDLAMQLALEVIEAHEAVLPGTAQVVLRSIWDEVRGHQCAGVLIEGRYRIADVRRRTAVRSDVLRSLMQALHAKQISMPAQPISLHNA